MHEEWTGHAWSMPTWSKANIDQTGLSFVCRFCTQGVRWCIGTQLWKESCWKPRRIHTECNGILIEMNGSRPLTEAMDQRLSTATIESQNCEVTEVWKISIGQMGRAYSVRLLFSHGPTLLMKSWGRYQCPHTSVFFLLLNSSATSYIGLTAL